MKIKHFSGKNGIENRNASGDSFILTNREGDYLWMGSSPESRYQGWFFSRGGGLCRLVESFSIEGADQVSSIINNFDYVETVRGRLKERFFLPMSAHVLVYELSEKKRVNVFFDVRDSYSHQKGEGYTSKKKGDILLLSFSSGVYVAVRGAEGEFCGEMVHRHYSYDKKRKSYPCDTDVVLALSLYGKRFVFSAAESEEEALREVKKIFVRTSSLEGEDIYRVCAKRSLSDLLVYPSPGLYAGLPWFFQFWPRDEAICLKALAKIEEDKAKSVFHRLLSLNDFSGPGGATHADLSGWLFKRAGDLLPIFSEEEREKIRRELKKSTEDCLWSFTEKGFAVNGDGETWMDTLKRGGARLEMQSLRLNMYSLGVSLSKRFKERRFYATMESEMKKKVRKHFFNGKTLFDGYDPVKNVTDETTRANIFISAYIYPQLLSRREWIKCFDNALSELWLPWGGIAGLSVKDSRFHLDHSGEDPQSYHNGDSWFYVNNITALVLHRFHKKRYASQIKKIMEASKKEMAWMGAVGRHGEVSSARELRSEGSPLQAWSAATYLEASQEIDI